MAKSRKIAKDVKIIWDLRSTFKKLLNFEDEFTDRADYILRSHHALFDALGPE